MTSSLDINILLRQLLGCVIACPTPGPAPGDLVTNEAQIQQFLREHGYPDAVVTPLSGNLHFNIVLTTRNGVASQEWYYGPGVTTLGHVLGAVSTIMGGPPITGGVATLDVIVLLSYWTDSHTWIEDHGGTCTTRHIICEGTMPIPALASVLAQPGVIRFRRPGAV